MSDRHIKVTYFDDEPTVYDNGKILNEKEIVDLLVTYFEDVDVLINCLEEVRHTLVSLGGLKAFDSGSERVVYSGRKGKCIDKHNDLYEIVDKQYTVYEDEIIELNFTELIGKIDTVIG